MLCSGVSESSNLRLDFLYVPLKVMKATTQAPTTPADRAAGPVGRSWVEKDAL
jgi:hypothetical protein